MISTTLSHLRQISVRTLRPCRLQQVMRLSTNGDAAQEEEIDVSKFTHAVELKFPDVAGKGYVSWNKAEGDLIKRGDTICDVVLEDFSFGIESEDDTHTLMGNILIKDEETIEPDTLICSIMHPEPDQDISE